MKSIVIYYSHGGNTRHVAEKVAAEIGADLAEIETVKPYIGSYDHVVDQGQKEVNSGFLPKIRQINADLSKYDTVILGTPVWWYTFAPAMNSFLHSADLSEKSVYPFATNGGWIGHTFKEEGVGQAIVKCGLPREELFITTKIWIRNAGYEKAKASIEESLKKLKTDYVDLLLIH